VWEPPAEGVRPERGGKPDALSRLRTGEPLGVEETRAAMLCRLLCLARGYSGSRCRCWSNLAAFLNAGIIPVVPCEGSVGASGDLTPLSYILAALAGEREVWYGGDRMPAVRALRKAKLKSYRFGPKEPLALINGTSVMTGIAAVNLDRAYHILEAAIGASALSVHALQGKADHYHRVIGEAKTLPRTDLRCRPDPAASDHPGQGDATGGDRSGDPPGSVFPALRPADPGSPVRCPDLALSRGWRIEANSANDNPLFAEGMDRPLTGGNFYGGHNRLCDGCPEDGAGVGRRHGGPAGGPAGQSQRQPGASGRPRPRGPGRPASTTMGSRPCPSPLPR